MVTTTKSLNSEKALVLQDLQGIVTYLKAQGITGGQAHEIYMEQADAFEDVAQQMYGITKKDYQEINSVVKKGII
ncbi:hypothetical protein [Bacillus paranthracis]|uniref:hypothetical protein n=1 Tax=Bacillus paranthracis TaxID=2026186 RepID=UPI003D64D180